MAVTLKGHLMKWKKIILISKTSTSTLLKKFDQGKNHSKCIMNLPLKIILNSVFSTFTSGMCAIGLYFVHSSRANLVVSAIFSSAISCGNAALDCLITEVFPTNLRATGVAVSMIAARLGGIIGNIVIATLLDMYCPAPTFIIAILLIGS
jgi:hypothetical protein